MSGWQRIGRRESQGEEEGETVEGEGAEGVTVGMIVAYGDGGSEKDCLF